ncbi:MAG: sodium:dicarboxylate symporter [Methylococcaceae bacterium TMED69]|nr:MAG: sodium:dicarboxylate symporter [Methylococcaceae bacterium TMED69]|tara:strand:+ start:2211 stop:3437 length:1227 start_codon:yes stop_codon:yes gene_type:complete
MKRSQHTFILWGTFLSVILGLLSGGFFIETSLKIQWIGQLFLNALKMTIIPLIFSAVVSGICNLNRNSNFGITGFITVTYYTVTTSIAVLIGLICVNLLEPGRGLKLNINESNQYNGNNEVLSFSDIPLSMVTDNLFKSATNGELLPIIIFGVLFAVALLKVDGKAERLIIFFGDINTVMMQIVSWIMLLTPIGVFALVSSRVAEAGGLEGFSDEIKAVGQYVACVIFGLAIHFFFLFLVLKKITTYGILYIKFLLRALLTAFGTASSSATLPTSLACTNEAGVNPSTSKFVLPLGATINMDGTALYEAVAVMFIAQAYGIELSIGQQVIVFITATLAAIGAAGIPQAGLVTMVLVLTAVNLPLEGVGLLLAVDWFLDRFRTTINVWGDSVGAAVVEQMTQQKNKIKG